MKTIRVILERGEDGYGVSFEDIPNVYSFGETLDIAKENAKQALNSFVITLKTLKKPIPEVLNDKYELVFEFDTVALLNYINGTITQSALSKASGINVAQISHYATGRRKPRQIQRQKIVEGLHRIGKDLLAVS